MSRGDTTVEFDRRCRHCGAPLSATSSFCSKCGATAEAQAGTDALREKLQAMFGADLDIERELGRGGMAVVYAGYDPALQRRVAVKVLLPEVANDRSMADRFLREARTVASLQHPHVVTVYAVRSLDNVHAIVMQFVEGRSLDAVLQDKTVLPVHVAGMLIAQAAEGLQHAHDRGVIHRDVKPANVLIDRDGRAIVSDFGIARRDHGPRTTDTGLVVGTWAYMSPEQRAADAIAPATDQYALGVMAFELLTGRLPFTGTPSEMMRAHMHEPPPSLRELRPEVSPAVEAVVHRMLAKDPADRFSSLKEPERAFRALVPDEGQTTLQLAAYSHVRQRQGSQVMAAAARPAAPPAATGAAGAAAAGANVRATAAPTPEPARSRGSVALGAAAGLVVLLAAYALTRGDPEPPATAGTSLTPAPTPPQAAAPNATNPDARDVSPSAQASGASRAPDAAGGGPPASPGSRQGTGSSVSNQQIAAAPLIAPRQEPVGKSAVTAVPTTDSAAVPPRGRDEAPRTEPPRPALPVATVADARRLGREFVTMLNQRRYRELAQIPAVGGDAAARAELLRLTESAPEFAAGFDRVPAAPDTWPQGFETECFVDLEWRGGRKVFRVRLYAAPADAGWRLAGIAVDPAN